MGARVAGRVAPRAAFQQVAPGAAFEQVVADATAQPVHACAAHQRVVARAAHEVLHPRQHVALRLAHRAPARRQVHRHARDGARVAGGVVAVAAGEDVAAGAAGQQVVARAAIQHVVAGPAAERVLAFGTQQPVGTGVAGQGVVAQAAGQVLDGHEHIARRIAPRHRASGQVDLHAACRVAVVGHVGAVATVQRVGAAAAEQHVGAATPDEQVVAGVARQLVGVARALQVLDVHQRVAFGIAPHARARGQVHLHGLVRARIGRQVGAVAAVELVLPGATHQGVAAGAAEEPVIARARHQHVGVGVARQGVVVLRAFQVLDAVVAVAQRVAGVAGRGLEAGLHALGGFQIAGGVGAFTAHQAVGAFVALQPVVARAPRQQVGAGVARQFIGEAAARQVLDVLQAVPLGVAAAALAGGEAHDDPGPRARVGGGVGALAAPQFVGARSAFQRVVTPAAVEPVGRRVAGEPVARVRADHRLDLAQRVAFGVAARGRARGQVHRDPGSRGAVVGRVAAFAAHERIGAAAARQQVVAGAARQAVGSRVAAQGVVARRTPQVFDAREGVALGVTPGSDARRQVQGHALGRGCIARGVAAGAADQRVRPRPAFENVAARATVQRVVALVAEQQVVAHARADLVVAGTGVDFVAQPVGGEHHALRTARAVDHVGGALHILRHGSDRQRPADVLAIHLALRADGDGEGLRDEAGTVARDGVLDRHAELAADIPGGGQVERPAVAILRAPHHGVTRRQAADRHRLDAQVQAGRKLQFHLPREAGAQGLRVVADDDVVARGALDPLALGLRLRRQVGSRAKAASPAGDQRLAVLCRGGLARDVVPAGLDGDGVRRRGRRGRRAGAAGRRRGRPLGAYLHHHLRGRWRLALQGRLLAGRRLQRRRADALEGRDLHRRRGRCLRHGRGRTRGGFLFPGHALGPGRGARVRTRIARGRLRRPHGNVSHQHLAHAGKQVHGRDLLACEADLQPGLGHHAQAEVLQHMHRAIRGRQHQVGPRHRDPRDRRAGDRQAQGTAGRNAVDERLRVVCHDVDPCWCRCRDGRGSSRRARQHQPASPAGKRELNRFSEPISARDAPKRVPNGRLMGAFPDRRRGCSSNAAARGRSPPEVHSDRPGKLTYIRDSFGVCNNRAAPRGLSTRSV